MSHITALPVKLKDLDAIRGACERLGFEFLEGQKSYVWYGQNVGDSVYPEQLRGLTNEQLGRCDHAIAVPGAKYTVGVVATAEGFELRWDYWGPGGLLQPLGGQNADRFVQAYALAAASQELAAQGYMLSEETLVDGTVRMTAVQL